MTPAAVISQADADVSETFATFRTRRRLDQHGPRRTGAHHKRSSSNDSPAARSIPTTTANASTPSSVGRTPRVAGAKWCQGLLRIRSNLPCTPGPYARVGGHSTQRMMLP